MSKWIVVQIIGVTLMTLGGLRLAMEAKPVNPAYLSTQSEKQCSAILGIPCKVTK